MKKLKLIILKEIKELLRDPKILVGIVLVPLVLFPIMGSAVQTSIKTAEEAVEKAPIGVLNMDMGNMSKDLISFLRTVSKTEIIEIEAENLENCLKIAQDLGCSALIVIPFGFTDNLTLGFKANIGLYALIKGTSAIEATSIRYIEGLIRTYEEKLSAQIISSYVQIDPSVALHPLSISYKTVFKGKIANIRPELLSTIMISQATSPIMILLIIVIAMQIAATSIAVEKEAKTLETLLSLPVARLSILMGKLIGSIIVGSLGALSYLAGFSYYFQSALSLKDMPNVTEEVLTQLGLTLSLESYIFLGLSIFIAIVSALALALTVAVFAEDVRSAQALVGYMYILIFIPAMILTYTDIGSLPVLVQGFLYAIPFTYPILIAKAVFTGNYQVIAVGLTYMAFFTVIVMYIAAKMFTTEKILTARISFRRIRR